jgi:hypothetical protein
MKHLWPLLQGFLFILPIGFALEQSDKKNTGHKDKRLSSMDLHNSTG